MEMANTSPLRVQAFTGVVAHVDEGNQDHVGPPLHLAASEAARDHLQDAAHLLAG